MLQLLAGKQLNVNRIFMCFVLETESNIVTMAEAVIHPYELKWWWILLIVLGCLILLLAIIILIIIIVRYCK